jgi:hypothetical protein
MRMGEFILQDMEGILARWEAFAASSAIAAPNGAIVAMGPC